MFIPGETISHTFIIPFDRTDIDTVIVSYEQKGHIVLERTIASQSEFNEYHDAHGILDPSKTEITVCLTQAESLLFEDRQDFTVQLNVYTGRSRHASAPIRGSNGIQHYKEVIGNA